jgi:N-methylhydantoinase B
VLDPGLSTEEKLHAKLTMTLRKGQVFRHDLPGAGGWGDALARDLSLVAKDLRDGLVTIEGAARDYGVVAGGDPPVIDEAATEALRAKLRMMDGPPPPSPLPQGEGEQLLQHSPSLRGRGLGGGGAAP